MASITIKRGTEEEVNNTEIQDGQILFTTDNTRNNKILADVSSTKRILIGGNNDFVGTDEEFEEAKESGNIFDGMLVGITNDYEEFDPNAVNINYDPTQSGLGDNVQEALDTVAEVMAVDSIPSGVGDGTLGGGIATLSTDLGNKSSASAVTGNDAFSKINTLNENMMTMKSDTYNNQLVVLGKGYSNRAYGSFYIPSADDYTFILEQVLIWNGSAATDVTSNYILEPRKFAVNLVGDANTTTHVGQTVWVTFSVSKN